MSKWTEFEEWLFDNKDPGDELTSKEFAESFGVDRREASSYIEAHLDEQRRPGSKALYTLHRKPGTRTTSAVWVTGQRAADRRAIERAFADDVARKATIALIPDIQHLAARNPRQAQRVEEDVRTLVDHLLPLIKRALAE